MEDTRIPSAAHSLQGPHRKIAVEVPAGFVPLRLVPEPGGMPLDVPRPDVVLGRHSDADIRLTLPDISRRHCRLVFEEQHWRVHDLASLNGVFVNGERVQESALFHGDVLQLGSSIFVIKCKRVGEDSGHQRMEKRRAS